MSYLVHRKKMSSPRADNSAENFCFEVPITNLKESDGVDVDVLYLNKITVDIPAIHADTAKEVLTESDTIVIDEIEGIKSPKRVEDCTNLIEIDGVEIDDTSDNNKAKNDVNNPKKMATLDKGGKNVITLTDSEPMDIDETSAIKPLTTTIDDPKRNDRLIIIDSTIVIDETVPENISVDNNHLYEMTVDLDKADKSTIVIDETVPETVDKNRINEMTIALDQTDQDNATKKYSEKTVAGETEESLKVVVNDQGRNEIKTECAILDTNPELTSKAKIDIKNVNDKTAINNTDIQSETNNNINEANSALTKESKIENIINEKAQHSKVSEDTKEKEDAINVDEDVVLLDENRTDSDVIILEEKTDSENTIILDDDEINKTEGLSKPIEVIDVEKDTDCSIVESNSKSNSNPLEIYKDNPLLLELIEKCLDMENTDGMARVINKTLLVIYKSVDEDYKKSEMFKKFLTKTIVRLDVEPHRKFSHIKNLCDELKLHKAKKRVSFITLEVNTSTEQSTSHVLAKRKAESVVINLDDDVTHNYELRNSGKRRKKIETFSKEYPSIEIDDSSLDDIDLITDNDVILVDKNYNSNKENSKATSQIAKSSNIPKEKKKNQEVEKKRKVSGPIKSVVKNTNKDQLCTSFKIQRQNNVTAESIKKQMDRLNAEIIRNIPNSPNLGLLKHRVAVEVDMTEEVKQRKIKEIEAAIAHEKKRLEKLEEAEVLTDCVMSPYIQCEVIKTTILSLYKQLCELTGTEVNKRHEVRLQVVPGHPEGPVRCLEEFLNRNIDKDGNPPFPDMYDVMKCVTEANKLYNMGWTHSQIVGEAHALFTQFGRKMQKRRQKREWKDLLSLVKDEVCDPAEDDPELFTKLEANSLLAMKKEHEILERFVNLEHGMPDPELRLSQTGDSDDDSDTPDLGNEGPIDPSPVGGTSMSPVVLNPLKANENTVRPHAENASKTDKNMDPNAHIPTNSIKSLGNVSFGSSVTACDGKIVIHPTIQYATTPNAEPRGPNNQTTVYSSEFKSFIYNNSKPTNCVLPNDKFLNLKANPQIKRTISILQPRPKQKCINIPQTKPKAHNTNNARKNSAGMATGSNNFVNTMNIARESSRPQITPITSIQKANAANLAKEILVLVQPDLYNHANNLARVDNLITKNQCTKLPTYIIPRSPKIVTNTNANNEPAKSLSNSATTVDISNPKNIAGLSNGFHVYTHASQPKTLPVVNNNSEILTTETAKKSNNSENNVFKVGNEFDRNEDSSSSTETETEMDIEDDITDINNIVKCEPPDIPSNENDEKKVSIALTEADKDNISDFNVVGADVDIKDSTDINDVVKHEHLDIPTNDNDRKVVSIPLSIETDVDIKDNVTDINDMVKCEPPDTPTNENEGKEVTIPSTESDKDNISDMNEVEADVDIKDNVTDINDMVKFEPPDIPTNENDGKKVSVPSTEADKDNTTDVNDVVKREPLDIPSMLEELGEGYPATIFDIEDPFLVIEISDSSESEEEVEDL